MADLVGMGGTRRIYPGPGHTPRVRPFQGAQYSLKHVDDVLLVDRLRAEVVARRDGLDWGRAYRTCKVAGSPGREMVVVLWQIR